MSWAAPANIGLANISSYKVQRKRSTESWDAASTQNSTSSPRTISGLRNGIEYNVRVLAVNSYGDGDPSEEVDGTPFTVPGAPRTVGVRPGDKTLEVSWLAPASDGGSRIVRYRLERKESDENWSDADSATSVASPHTFRALKNVTTYNVRVFAVNDAGDGSSSSVVDGTPVLSVPNSPRVVRAVEGDRTLTVTWLPPSGAGEALVSGYRVEWQEEGTTTKNRASGTSPHGIRSLRNGKSYIVQVIAINSSGDGEPSESVRGTPSTVPGTPTGVSVTRGNRSLQVNWGAPSDNGGLAVTGYVVQWKLSGDDFDSSSPEYTIRNARTVRYGIPNLRNGTTFDVRVFAVNENGRGTPSSATPATPGSVPGAPPVWWLREAATARW